MRIFLPLLFHFSRPLRYAPRVQERTCLLLITQVTSVVLVSSLPVRLSVTSWAWKLGQSGRIPSSSRVPKAYGFLECALTTQWAGAECDWMDAFNRRHDCISLFALGDVG